MPGRGRPIVNTALPSTAKPYVMPIVKLKDAKLFGAVLLLLALTPVYAVVMTGRWLLDPVSKLSGAARFAGRIAGHC